MRAISLPPASLALTRPLPWWSQSRAGVRIVAEGLALLFLFTGLMALIQFATPGLADHDGYYHMRLARLMWEQGLKPDFVWLPFSLLSPAAYYDHHFLHHVYLALFAGSPEPDALILGAKLASTLMPALAFLAVWWLLRGQGVRWAGLWALALFAVSEAFLYRMSMPRAQSASLLILALGLHWLLQRRYAALIPLGFVYVWWYNAFPLLAVVAGAYAAAAFVTERRVEWKAVVYPLIGLALGLIVNPYFPQNIAFIIQHVLPKIGPEATATSVGNEWYPYPTWTLVENSGGALAAFIIGAFALGWRGQRLDRRTLTAFALAVVFGYLLFKSRRFVEYAPAFALIFAAFSVSPLVESWLAERARWARAAAVGAVTLLALPLALTMRDARGLMETSLPPDRYAAAMNWLKAHAAPGSLLFQTDWDDFPRLFFYNTDSLYTIGLDPTYMQFYDPALYDEWVSITRGQVAQPGAAIRDRFGAEFVFTDLKHGDFLRQARSDPALREVYRDDTGVILQVVR